jgi:hypothetical protein
MPKIVVRMADISVGAGLNHRQLAHTGLERVGWPPAPISRPNSHQKQSTCICGICSKP